MYLVYLTILQKSIRKETSLASGFLWKTANRKIARAYGTGGDNSNKGCFGRKTNLFRESGDFAGNRETWEIFREI